ncbi:lipoate--protein ligase [Novibacillus thermophilus]|uniref:lipoate--protein ligase n=1 Tax=Novibacillus thermophilus TaxID=1471761 RepID=A0A1U9K690_9BACL|nr:lipoate--protein ligase [Novibacillus thermophilus]AQS55551.1 lipoate--protein ligase [Novibacillus thermophilus]
MLYIQNDSTDPRYNLALEEYVFKHLKFEEDFIMLWQNEPSVIVGKNQNTVEEINVDYVEQHGIHVVRRSTGGGAVYHDLGNLNYTFITKADGTGIDFRKFTQPVIRVLNSLGVPAEFNSRNDIAIRGKKFSGNAQRVYKNRVLHHGTIMFNSKLEDVHNVLKVKAEKFKSKSVKSVRSRVTNISDYLPEPITIDEFKKLLLERLFLEQDSPKREYLLTEEDQAEIRKMMEEKYANWEWNYGYSPKFNYEKTDRFDGGTLQVRLNVVKGIIEECKIYGDFFGVEDVQDVENRLKGVRYDRAAIQEALQGVDLDPYFGGITRDELLSCFF